MDSIHCLWNLVIKLIVKFGAVFASTTLELSDFYV